MQANMQTDGISRHTIVILLTLTLVLTIFTFPPHAPICQADTPPTLYVGPDETFQNIQDAIDNASDGYRIIVYAGTYQEALTIDKTLDLFGEDRAITTINGNSAQTVITINADYVNISHFTITNSATTADSSLIQVNADKTIITDNTLTLGNHAIILNQTNQHLIYDNTITTNNGDGIQLIQSNNNINISYNTIQTNQNGIFLYQSDSNRIYHNTITNNNANGLFLNHSADNNFLGSNTISNNEENGIYLNDYSNYSTIRQNTITDNDQTGLILENCSLTTISDNTINDNTYHGIMLIGSTNTIQANTISDNQKNGIFLTADDNTTITQNTIQNNEVSGIQLYNSTADYIHANEISGNENYGVYVDFFAIQNTIYNNYFHHNTQNAIDKSIQKNFWNQTPTTATNIIGGSTIAGNYWDDYDETNEGVSDANQDGIADSSYTIYNLNTDDAPILDTTPATIQTITINPTSQTLSQETTIQATITDNTEIKDVYLYIIKPDSSIQNISITQNKSGNTYSTSYAFSPIGSFNFSVQTKDPMQWTQSSLQPFHIVEGSAPTISDNSPDTGRPSASYIFNVTVQDDQDQAAELSVNINWSHASKSGNYSLTHAGNNFFTRTIQLDASIQPLRYTIYASDHWGNSITGTQTTITVTDIQPPHITILQYTPQSQDVPDTFTFTVGVVDDTAVDEVSITYWYEDSTNYTVSMDAAEQNRYTKTIVPMTPQHRVSCVITATDTSGNIQNTKAPTAQHGGPYAGFIRTDITFNGSTSYDLDGEITNYTWDFGDGTNGTGSTTTHQYLTSGNYTVTLMVTDNHGNTDNASTTTTISYYTTTEASYATIQEIETSYNLTLPQRFFCFDDDGDSTSDNFVDPNGILIHIPHFNTTINNAYAFAISIDDQIIPEFLWVPTTDDIYHINHQIGIIQNVEVNEQLATAQTTVSVNKVDWLLLDINDQYPDATLTITTNQRTIPSNMIYRTNGHIYVLDDALTEYIFHFTDIFPPVDPPIFSPSDGGIIDGNHTTITITYNTPVTILSATFGSHIASADLETNDNMIYFYTPPGYLPEDMYTFTIQAESSRGFDENTANIVYFYFPYTTPPPPSLFETHGHYIIFGTITALILAAFVILYQKQITLDGYIYIKNKRIIPFFKTIVFGPLSVHVKNDAISKAEFYVDGQLKNTLTEPPFIWHWNEQALLRHSLETKVYDASGNHVSSGEMDLFVFNIYTSMKQD